MALKRFIDDVAVEVVEAKLVSALDRILPPNAIFQMSDDHVAHIAGESEETRSEREQLGKQLDVLRNGLETCKRFVGFRVSGGEDSDSSPCYINFLTPSRLGLCFRKGLRRPRHQRRP